MVPPSISRAARLPASRLVLECLSTLVAIHYCGGQESAVQCPVDLSRGNFRLHNASCSLTFLPVPDDTKQRQGASVRSQPRPSALLLVSLLSSISNAGEETLCGFDRADLSNRTASTSIINRAGSTINGTLVVRRGIDRRWLLSSVFVETTWRSIVAWTNAQLTVVFDSSCAGDSGQLFVHQSVPAWSICRQFADGLSFEFEQWNDSVIFAQDRRLSQWLPLPSDNECADGKDYELTISSANPTSTLSITLYSGPGFNSCRSLCVAEQCNITVLSSSSEMTAGTQSITVRYKHRSAASACDSLAYTGFAVVLQVQPASSITLTTRVLDSVSYFTTESSISIILLSALIAAGVVVLIIVAVIVTLVVRRKARNKQRHFSDTSSSTHGRPNNKTSAATAGGEGNGGNLLQYHPTSSTAAAFRSGHNERSPAVELPDLNSDDVYAEIDDTMLSEETPMNTTISGRDAHLQGETSFTHGHLVPRAAPRSMANGYCGLGDRLDTRAYSVPHKWET